MEKIRKKLHVSCNTFLLIWVVLFYFFRSSVCGNKKIFTLVAPVTKPFGAYFVFTDNIFYCLLFTIFSKHTLYIRERHSHSE